MLNNLSLTFEISIKTNRMMNASLRPKTAGNILHDAGRMMKRGEKLSAVSKDNKLIAYRFLSLITLFRSFSLFRAGLIFGGHAVLFVGPATEIYHLASLGAEGAPLVALPHNRLATRRALHKTKVRRRKGKVKA